MYNNSATDNGSSQFGIGKGLAQVWDNTPLREAAQQSSEQTFRSNQNRAKQSQGREDDINSQLGALNKIAIFDRDKPKFAQMQNDLYGLVKKNIDKIRSGDTSALLEVQQSIGNIFTEAELSKNTREQVDTFNKDLLTKGFDSYRPETVENYMTFVNGGGAGEHIGNYDISGFIPEEAINYTDRRVNKLLPYAKSYADANSKGHNSEFTIDQAEKLIEDDLMDAGNFKQAVSDFKNAKDKLGASNPIDFYKRLHAPELVLKSNTPYSEWEVNGGKNSAPSVAGTYTNEGDGKGRFQFEYTNTQDNPYITIKNPNNSKQSIEIKPIAVNLDGKKTGMEAAVKLSESERTANAAAEASGEPKPYPETIELDYNHVSDIMHNKFGIKNVFDIPNNNTPSHVKVKYNDASKKEKKTPSWDKYKRK